MLATEIRPQGGAPRRQGGRISVASTVLCILQKYTTVLVYGSDGRKTASTGALSLFLWSPNSVVLEESKSPRVHGLLFVLDSAVLAFGMIDILAAQAVTQGVRPWTTRLSLDCCHRQVAVSSRSGDPPDI